MSWYFVLLLVVCRIIAATWANVLQKQSVGASDLSQSRLTPLIWLIAIWSWMTLILAPWWMSSLAELSGKHPSITIRFWGWMFLACSMEVPGNYLLLRSLQRTDLSIFGPLSSYKPIFGMLLAWLLIAETPNVLGFIGMLVVLLGSYMLADPVPPKSDGHDLESGSSRTSFWHSGVRDRLAGVALTAAGAVVMKISMLASDPLVSLAVWSAAGWVIAVVFLAGLNTHTLVARRVWQSSSEEPQSTRKLIRLITSRNAMVIAIVMMAMQGSTILVLKQMPVGYALALFQLGSLLSVYVGHRWFGEGQLWRRLGAAAVMVLGAALIVFSQ